MVHLVCRALTHGLKQPNQRVGGSLPVRAILVIRTSDRVSLFNKQFGLGSHERPS